MWLRPAQSERISNHFWRTRAHRDVVDDVAVGICAARPDTRVLAFITNAGFVSRTFAADDALGSTAFVRVAGEFWEAFADAVAVANGVRTTRRRIAWVDWRRSGCRSRHKRKYYFIFTNNVNR